jgi:PhnB protein
MTTTPARPAGSNTVNPFIMTDDARRLIAFVTDVFGAVDVAEARTVDTDGLILHSEVLIGDSMITIADRKPSWPFTPAFIRVYVDDVAETLARAEHLGASIVTQPTDFFGDVFARIQDPQANLWWIYRHNPAADAQSLDHADAADGEASWESFASPELEYIHSTLVDAMAALTDPRASSAR